MTTPPLPTTPQEKQVIEFCIWFRSLAGFVAKYEELLAVHGSPFAAYEATEVLYVSWFNERRYDDKDVFYPVLSRYRRERSHQPLRLAA